MNLFGPELQSTDVEARELVWLKLLWGRQGRAVFEQAVFGRFDENRDGYLSITEFQDPPEIRRLFCSTCASSAWGGMSFGLIRGVLPDLHRSPTADTGALGHHPHLRPTASRGFLAPLWYCTWMDLGRPKSSGALGGGDFGPGAILLELCPVWDEHHPGFGWPRHCIPMPSVT